MNHPLLYSVAFYSLGATKFILDIDAIPLLALHAWGIGLGVFAVYQLRWSVKNTPFGETDSEHLRYGVILCVSSSWFILLVFAAWLCLDKHQNWVRSAI